MLLFDLSATQPLSGRFHGGAEYARSVFFELLPQSSKISIRALYDPRRAMDADIADAAAAAQVELVPSAGYRDLDRAIRRMRPRVFFSALPYQLRQINTNCTTFYATIHGLRPIEVPTDRYASRYGSRVGGTLKHYLKRAFPATYRRWRYNEFQGLLPAVDSNNRIIVPSLHTKYLIASLFPDVSDEQLVVLPSPPTEVMSCPRPDFRILRQMRLNQGSYILLLSTNRWIKNSFRAISAYATLRRRGLLPLPLVAVGGLPRGVPEDVREHIEVVEEVSVGELAALYKGAYIFFYPSLNEGYGYPPLEAMRWGTCVLCSATSAMPEVLGGAPAYVCPYSIEDMQSRLLALWRDREQRAEIAERGRRHAAEELKRQKEGLAQLCSMLESEARE